MARFYHRLSVFKENHVKTFDLTGFAKSALLVMLASIVALHVAPATAQDGGWTHWGADAASTRYAPFDQIDASNFGDLEVAWVWRGDNFGPSPYNTQRSTPIYADGKLFSVAGERRTVVAIEPTTGETLWTFREPETKRWADSMRKSYGKGVAYEEVNGEGRIYIVTPAFFLHVLDADTGVPIAGFGDNGTIDLLAKLRVRLSPDRWAAGRSRVYHQLVAPDRDQRRGRHRQQPRAGISADPARERARAHPRLRRHQRRFPVEIQRHSAVGERVRVRHVGERRLVVDR